MISPFKNTCKNKFFRSIPSTFELKWIKETTQITHKNKVSTEHKYKKRKLEGKTHAVFCNLQQSEYHEVACKKKEKPTKC